MALVTCPDCGTQYDQSAAHCPNCGRPNPFSRSGSAAGGETPRAGGSPPPGGGTPSPDAGGAGQTGGAAGQGGGFAGGATGGQGGARPGGAPPPPPPYGGGGRPEVPNYLVFAIFLTLCCCPPLAIPALINAARVDVRRDLGDLEGAWEASRQAKKWCIIALIVGGVIAVVGSIVYGTFVSYVMQNPEVMRELEGR